MSLWNLSQGLHFGFSTILLTKVCVKHFFKETEHDLNPRCGSVCFLFILLPKGDLVYLTLSLSV